MIRNLVLLVNLFVALFLNLFFQTPVDITIQAPSMVTAGESFDVTVTLNKGSLTGFSRYLQQIPYGLTATASSSANADFSFKDQKVRLIWLRLPNEESVTFTYKIHIDQRLKGEFNMEGLFSYIENNERKSANSQTPAITIMPSPNLTADQVIDIKDFENAVIQNLKPRAITNVMCYRQIPQVSENNDGLIINIIVKKGAQERFAKIEEIIPTGFNVVSIDNKDAIFSSKESLVKFLWMNLPSDEYFNVSYKLVPQNGEVNKNINIKGTFSYIEDDDKTVSIDIIQEDFVLADNSSSGIQKVFDQINNRYYGQPADDKTALKEPVDTVVVTKKTDKVIKTRPTFVTKKTDKDVKSEADTRIKRGSSADLLKPEKGIYYRIQIAAGHKPVNVRQYFKKFNLEKNVKKENHDGWYKYSVGSFEYYKEARDYRNYIWRTTLIDDAFVSAYNNGERITVQEALMVANQLWYK